MAYLDLQVTGHGLCKQKSLALCDSYYVVFAPRSRSKRSSVKRCSAETLMRSLVEEMANPLFEDNSSGANSPKKPESKASSDSLSQSRSAIAAGHVYGAKRHPKLKDYVELYESEVVHHTSNPTWKPARIDFNDLCAGNLDALVMVQCYDWNPQFQSTLIGASKVSVRQLLRCQDNVLPLVSFLGSPGGALGVAAQMPACETMTCGFEVHAFDLPARKFTDSDIYFSVTAGRRISETPNAFTPPGSGANIVTTPAIKIGTQSHAPLQDQREVYESECNKDATNPHWNSFSVGFYELCRANDEAEVTISLYRRKMIGADRLVGSVVVPVKSLIAKQSQTLSMTKHNSVTTASVYISCKAQGFDDEHDKETSGSNELAKVGNSSM